ncbi:SPOC domain-like protein [Cutaneotrichosporon oleaginosum]|uniref:ATP-dependent DNA helicase II subunit 2 n=1 Tax=Cutaneotrichosporon oleaginosum TaxID=879819 RepID=A0A0J0XMS2_9TREE|nr:SPOC domain-like protein [Cutaneotrichosporon oleaginosum]KLT42387.1 SPOC domain-like protein [Cutaneotrichosporon oleaginosum]TXT04206.1 hypothetical protein COLE_07903 [Cutaneotrichosporon oleaginosum]
MAYSVVVYALDVSPSMVGLTADLMGGKAAKLDLGKEYIARMCEPKIQSGRKTEHVGLVSFGGRTHNQANAAWVAQHGDEDPPYIAVSSDVAIQSAKPKILEALMNLEVGEEEGNPVSALMVALDMVEHHKHTKRWTIEIKLVTDGESSFVQEEYEEAMKRLDKLGVKLTVIGIDFDDPKVAVDKSKSKAKRLSEKFWRAFVKGLHEEMSRATDSEIFLPQLLVFHSELAEARRPHPATTEGTVSSIKLHIGAEGVDADEAISIPMHYSKATMKARPPSLSKTWKTAVDVQTPARDAEASQLLSQLESQGADASGAISGKINRHIVYFIRKGGEPASTQATQSQSQTRIEDDPDFIIGGRRQPQSQSQTQTLSPTQRTEEDLEPVEKEDLVKAWRFGSSLIPVEADTFAPLRTEKSVEVLGFIPQANVRKYMLMGEVRYLWPDMSSKRAQIQFSAFVSALYTTSLVAITRFVARDYAEPVLGVAFPEMDYRGENQRLDLMYWIRLPYADDEHKFWFPSLEKYISTTGKQITEHPYIPTDEQCNLMDELVSKMDLDTIPPPGEEAKEKTSDDSDEDDSEDSDKEEDDEEESKTWFSSARAVNPAIHRIKEAIFHASLTADPEAHPLGPPHPEITQYFHTPAPLADKVEKLTERLKDALDIKKVPPKQRRQANKEVLRDDEGFLDIDDLFGGAPSVQNVTVKEEGAGGGAEAKAKPADNNDSQGDTKPTVKAEPVSPQAKAKAKPGRLISNERPLEDYRRLVQGEGDLFRKAIIDLAAVVKENVAASFSRQAFPLALECLEAMRTTALTFEEVETYNDAIEDLERTVKSPGFKHPDFWDHFEKAGSRVARISEEEAEAALEEEEYD